MNSMSCAGETRSRLKSGRKGGLTRGPLMQKPTQLETMSGYSRKSFPQKEPEKLLKKRSGPFQTTEVHQGGQFYELSSGRAAHYEKTQPHNASSEDWCIPLTCMMRIT